MNAWTTLGLDRTSDPAAIRRAYARRLKAIDVDADPEIFIALRTALEGALAEAAHAASPPSVPALATVAGIDPAEARPVGEGELTEAPADDGLDARLRALQRLLSDPGGASPDPDALAAALRSILDHSDMAHVDCSRRVEILLAETARRAIPRSDPIAPLLVRHFQWERNEGRIDQPPIFDVLITRARGQDLIGLVADPEHPMFAAYCSLLGWGPEVGARASRALDPQVRRLLTVIRERAPAAEASLDRTRVTQWDLRLGTTPPTQFNRQAAERGPDGGATGGGMNPGKWIFGLFLLMMVARIASCVTAPH